LKATARTFAQSAQGSQLARVNGHLGSKVKVGVSRDEVGANANHKPAARVRRDQVSHALNDDLATAMLQVLELAEGSANARLNNSFDLFGGVDFEHFANS
jgi:hypothetical protein